MKRRDHDEVDELLPWFVNGSLSEKEERRVLGHLRDCAECRVERDRLQEAQRLIVEDADSGVPDYRAAFRKLMKRIEVHEANLESARDVEPKKGLGQIVPYLATAACLFVVVAFVVALNPARSPEDAGESAGSAGEYRTLTTSPGRNGDASRRLALTFDEPASTDVIRSTLIETRSSIVAGPNEEGTYIVEIEVPNSVSPDAFLESLRRIEGVRYAAFTGEDRSP